MNAESENVMTAVASVLLQTGVKSTCFTNHLA